MSVETSYFIVDWAMLQSMAPDTDLVEHFILGPDSGAGDQDASDEKAVDEDEFDEDALDDAEAAPEWQAEGARPLHFGDYDYYFQSWGFSTEVSDWLQPRRSRLDASVAQPFVTLFSDIGILFDDDHGPVAVKSGVPFSDTSLLATLAPADVTKLRAIASALDRSALEREFGRLLAERPCPGLPNGEVVVEWVNALEEALSAVGEHEGVLILAPA